MRVEGGSRKKAREKPLFFCWEAQIYSTLNSRSLLLISEKVLPWALKNIWRVSLFEHSQKGGPIYPDKNQVNIKKTEKKKARTIPKLAQTEPRGSGWERRAAGWT
jgi:hypothetical protein